MQQPLFKENKKSNKKETAQPEAVSFLYLISFSLFPYLFFPHDFFGDDVAFGVVMAEVEAEDVERVVDAAVEVAGEVACGVEARDRVVVFIQALHLFVDDDAGAAYGEADVAVYAVERSDFDGAEFFCRDAHFCIFSCFGHFVVVFDSFKESRDVFDAELFGEFFEGVCFVGVDEVFHDAFVFGVFFRHPVLEGFGIVDGHADFLGLVYVAGVEDLAVVAGVFLREKEAVHVFHRHHFAREPAAGRGLHAEVRVTHHRRYSSGITLRRTA